MRGLLLAGALTLVCARPAFAATVNWIGPATGGNWSDAANWQDATTSENRVPGADDVATFTPSTFVTNTLDVATTVLGIKVNAGGTFTLNGDGTKKLTLGTNGIHAANATARTRINVPIELSAGNVKFTTSTDTSDYTRYIDLYGVVSGPGRLYQSGLSAVLLRTNNTFTGGVRCYSSNSTVNDKGCIYVYKSDSLGGPDGNGVYGTVTMDGAGTKRGGIYFVNSGLTIENPIVANHKTRSLLFATAVSSITFNNTNTYATCLNIQRISNGSGSAPNVYFKKPFVKSNPTDTTTLSVYMGDKIGSHVYFQGGVFLGYKTKFSIYNRGQLHFYEIPEQTNTWAGLLGRGGCIHCEGANVLPAAAGTSVLVETYSVVNLKGHDQKVNRIGWTTATAGRTDVALVSTGSAATIEVTNADNVDDNWRGYVGGTHTDTGTTLTSQPLTFIWNPKNKNTMTFHTQTSTTAGDLVVSNGTIALASSAKFSKIANLRIADGATFKIDVGSSINVKANVYIDGAGQIDLSSGQGLEVANVIVNGEVQEKGETYVSETSSLAGTKVSWLKGDAAALVVTEEAVTPTTATWTGEAGESDTSVRTAQNWEGATLPDLTYGGLTPTFATGGAVATVDAALKLNGLAFDAAGDFTLADGGGSIKLKNGLTATGAHVYTVESPVTMNGAQTWTVNGTANVVAEGTISCATGAGISKAGTGALTVKGENTFTGNFDINNGSVTLQGEDATLGAANAGQVNIAVNKVLYLDNAVSRRKIAYLANNYLSDGPIRSVAGSTNVILGTVTYTENGGVGRNLCMTLAANSQVVLAGGFSVGGWLLLNGSGELVISNNAVSCSLAGVYSGSHRPVIRFQKDGNLLSSDPGLQMCDNSGITWHFEVDNAFTSDYQDYYPRLKAPPAAAGSTTVHLHGTTQRFDGLEAAYANATITSEEPGAVLNVYTRTGGAHNWTVTGNVSLNKWGSNAMTFNRSGTATGTFKVSEGTLAFASGAQWSNLTNVTATGTGVVKMSATDAISRKCDVVLDGADAKLNLDFDGTVQCGRLFMRDGENRLRPVRSGVYGASDNASAPIPLANITGTGLLRVRRPAGVVVYMR